MRILYSFGMRLGGAGVGYAAERQVESYQRQGCEVDVFTASTIDSLPDAISVTTTLQAGRFRVPLRGLGVDRAFALHDRWVAAKIAKAATPYDIVHAWPGCSYRTLQAAKRSGALAVREAPNTHTAHAYSVVEREYIRLGLRVSGSHARNERRLNAELHEYKAADVILAPSELAAETFVAYGVPAEKVVIREYGFDPERMKMDPDRPRGEKVTFAFVGRSDPRKGLHLALQAWRKSGVADTTRFLIFGSFDPDYQQALAQELSHPNLEIRGFLKDPRGAFIETDALVLPSVEEGSALVTYEAQGAACALLVSRASGARLTPGIEGLVHEPGDVEALAEHMRTVATDAAARKRMQHAAYAHAPKLTWDAAAQSLLATLNEFLKERTAS